MKKIFKFLTATFLIMTTCVSTVLVSCKDKPTEQVDPAKQDVLFADFEAWAPDLQMARHMNGFGKLSLNEDKTYVSHGEKSVRLDPLGWYGAGSLPLVFFRLNQRRFITIMRIFLIRIIYLSIFITQMRKRKRLRSV